MQRRVRVYVDGFNLYFGLRSAGMKRYYWLDLVALGRTFLRARQDLVGVRYFTARIRDDGSNAADRRRQSTCIDALRTFPLLSLHEGRFMKKTRRCRACGATWTSYEEKMSDVNIAVELLMDAVDDLFDTAIIVSGDSDLATPVRRVLERFPSKRVVIAFPPARHSAELKNAATTSFRIGPDKLRKSLLPDRVVTPEGVILARPPGWR